MKFAVPAAAVEQLRRTEDRYRGQPPPSAGAPVVVRAGELRSPPSSSATCDPGAAIRRKLFARRNQAQKVIDRRGVRRGALLSDILGKNGRRILDGLVEHATLTLRAQESDRHVNIAAPFATPSRPVGSDAFRSPRRTQRISRQIPRVLGAAVDIPAPLPAPTPPPAQMGSAPAPLVRRESVPDKALNRRAARSTSTTDKRHLA